MSDYEPKILSVDTQRHLTEVLQERKPAYVVEVGSWLGESARLILNQQSVKMLYCIDTWLGSLEHQKMDPAFLSKLYDCFIVNSEDLITRIQPIRLDSINGMLRLHEQHIPQPELFFLDGGHSTWQVYADLKTIEQCWPEVPILLDDARDGNVNQAIHLFTEANFRTVYWREWSALIGPSNP